MPFLLQNIKPIVCRSCGATYAAASEANMPDICANCWARFNYTSPKDHSIEAFDRWLARKLILDLRRLQRFGVVGRCEALSHFSETYKGRGWQQQCGANANMLRDGRRVCGNHGKKAKEVTFIEEAPNVDGYTVIEHLLRELSAKDAKLLAALRSAAREAEGEAA